MRRCLIETFQFLHRNFLQFSCCRRGTGRLKLAQLEWSDKIWKEFLKLDAQVMIAMNIVRGMVKLAGDPLIAEQMLNFLLSPGK